MIFSSYSFILVFLPITIATFFVCSLFRRYRAAMATTIVFSLVFYSYWNVVYLPFLLALIVINYGLGRHLFYSEKNRKTVLLVGIVFNLSVLAYFKYTDFLLANINTVFGISIPAQQIVLPLAISFFTFQKIAFLVDAYRHKFSKLDFQDYCLFVVFFPPLIAGPIVHYTDLKPQFDKLKRRGPTASNFAIGLGYFFIGLFKKVIVADGIAQYANPVFDLAATGSQVSASSAWVGALAYTFQLYFDFSGYSDMAIGLARMFSIRLPSNFNSPYQASSVVDFWRRWHITLSLFLRDYVYVPLGGNRYGVWRRYSNLLLTMVLGGLWHGAGWTFVIWGGLHGLYLAINHLWKDYVGPERMIRNSFIIYIYNLASISLTFLCIVIGWVIFRATSVSAAFNVIEGMFGFGSPDQLNVAAPVQFGLLGLLFIATNLMPNSQQIMESSQFKWREKLSLAAIGIGGYVALMLLNKPTEFIYFRF